MKLARLSMMALLVLGSALPLQAYLGMVVGTPTGGNEYGNCSGAELLGPTVGNLYMSRENDPTDILAILNGGAYLKGCNGWTPGGFDCPDSNFRTPPTSPSEAVWAVVPMYPSGEAAGTHRGWVYLDVTPGGTQNFGPNITQGLWILSAEPGVKQGGTTAADPTVGVDLRFRGIVELGRTVGSAPACGVGGAPTGTAFDDRPILGYNVYRLSGVAAATSDPEHYLCGQDKNCAAADASTLGRNNGWVAFIPSGTGSGGTGLNLSAPAAAASANDNNTGDAFGVQAGPTGTGVEQDVHLIYSDNPVRSANAPTSGELDTQTFTYAFQPVLKGTASQDVDGDTIADLDLNADTVPEFISPQGSAGLGLTADIQIGGSPHRVILLSADVTAAGPTPTPAGDALQFQGVYNGRTQAFDINFISAMETGVAGFNLYRSVQASDSTGYVKVNGALIPAKGSNLSSYVYSDPLRVQTRRGSLTFYYKVEAVRTDGTVKLYGPFEVTYTGAAEQRRDRGMR